MPAKKKAKKKK